MTPDARREFLESRGFHVARRSFAGKTGPLWYVQEGLPLPPAGGKYPEEKKYFVDLADGTWMRWGTCVWNHWSVGPWHELAESESAGPSIESQPQRELSEERLLVTHSGATKQRRLF